MDNNRQLFLRKCYDIEGTIKFLVNKSHGYDIFNVALQFPDILLKDSTDIVEILEEEIKIQNPSIKYEFYILADTSYGSCCVDAVAAQHVNANCMLHYGTACLSRSYTNILPIYYIFGNLSLNIDDFIVKLSLFIEKNVDDNSKIYLFCDLSYYHLYNQLYTKINDKFNNIIIPKLRNIYENIEYSKFDKKTTDIGGFELNDDMNNDIISSHIIYINKELDHKQEDDELYIRNIMLRLNQCKSFHVYNHDDFIIPNINTQRIIGRRYYLIEKAKTCQIFGILVGTLAIQQHIDAIKRIKELLKMYNKQTQIFVVGKINEPKISNFSEVDMYVIVACSLNSLIETRDFYHDIITLYELEMAFHPERSWDGQYSTNYRDLLAPNGLMHLSLPYEDEEKKNNNKLKSDEPFYSPITQTLIKLDTNNHDNNNNEKKKGLDQKNNINSTALIDINDQSGELIQQNNQDNIYTRFKERTFKGLDLLEGDIKDTTIKMGKIGIAKTDFLNQKK